MDFLSISRIFGERSSPVKLFRCIFDEYAIPQLSVFYNIWNGDNGLDSLNRSIRRMMTSEPKSYTQKYRTLAEILTQTDTFLQMNSHIDSFISEYKGTDLLDILHNVTNEIRLDLADDSSFSSTLSLLWDNIEKPYAKARLLSWCIIYLIFKQHHVKFQRLYDITNTDSYRELYCNIIGGEEILRNYYIYQRNTAKARAVPIDTSPVHHEAESYSIYTESAPSNTVTNCFCGKAASPLTVNKNFIGRIRERSIIEESLKQCHIIFIQGMGGIGKSELVKAYAYQHRAQYNTILFLSYEHNLCETFINEQQINIKGISRFYDAYGRKENDTAYFHRKLQKIKDLSDESTLLILDNFDTEFDPHLEEFLSGNYHVLITTRNSFVHLGLPILKVDEMEPETEQITLFRNYYKKALNPQEIETIFQLMRILNGHTYAIELIAKLMFSKRISPQNMVEILKKDGITPQLKGNVAHGFQQAASVYDNIRKLFLFDRLNEDELLVMRNLTLVPISGFDLEEFADLCGLEDCEIITALCSRSWIRHDEVNDLVSLHPLIADIITNEYGVNMKYCAVFLQHFCEKISDSYNMLYSDKLRYTEIALKICRKIPMEFPEAYQLFRYIGILLVRMEFSEMSNKLLKDCLDFSLKTYGEYSKHTAEAYCDFCDCALYDSDYNTSLKYIKKSIDIMYRLDNTSAELAYFLKNKVWCLIDTVDIGSDMTEIFNTLAECSLIMKEKFPASHPQIASLNTAYAYAYCYNNQYDKALDYANRAYNIFYQLYGDVHSDTIAPLGIKALALSAMHRMDEAVSLCLHVIEIQKVFFGEEHLKALKRYETLAKIYQNGN